MIKQKWELATQAYDGNGGFGDGSHIERYTRESDDKYKARKKVAYYTNLFRQKVARYTGYLYRERPTRTTSQKLIKTIFDDADKRGNSLDVFMASFASQAKVRGSMLVLIDMPKELPTTLKEQLDQRALPYLVPIAPERVTKYKIDPFGKFEFIQYKDTIDQSTATERKVVEVERYYDTTTWKVISGDEILEQGTHDLGLCPMLQFSETGIYPAIGEFTQIADLAKRHYNLKSELDEILRSQTFSILTIQHSTPKDIELHIGTDNAIGYTKDVDRPDFIAPPAAPAEIYQREIATIEETINRIAYDVDTHKSQESGIALQIKFQGLNGSLGNFAMRLQDLEERIFQIVCLYLGTKNDITIRYPTEFNIVDVQEEIAILESIKSLGYTLPHYEKAKLERIIKTDLGGISEEEMEQIGGEIEDGLKSVG